MGFVNVVVQMLPSKTVALSPNCHRKLQYCHHKDYLKNALYKTIERLKRE